MLIPCEQLYIQTYHQNGHLIPEQNAGERNPLLQLIIDRQPMTYTTVKTKIQQLKPSNPHKTVAARQAYIPPQAP
jgi:hypothetical protein